MRERLQREDGATIVILAGAFVVLLLFAGLAIDVPIAMAERRDAQNAVDNAALAAAYASCTGSDQASSIAAGEASATGNGYTDGGNISVAVTAGSGSNEFTATIGSVSDAFFARVIGIDDYDISVTATAECSSGGGNAYAMFAIGDDCPYGPSKDQILFSGSNNTINGATHSNGNLYTGGSDNDFGTSNPGIDEVTYRVIRDKDDEKWPNQYWDPGQPDQVAALRDDPLMYDIADYRPGGRFSSDANYRSFTRSIWPADITGPGIYYTTRDITLDDEVDETVTLIAEGEISFSGSDQDLSAYSEGLLSFSNKRYSDPVDRCSKFVTKMEGSNNDWNGVIYSPRGMIEMAGSSNSAVQGSLISWSIEISGSDVSITMDDDLFSGEPISKITQ